jgi:hypothetical protein
MPCSATFDERAVPPWTRGDFRGFLNAREPTHPSAPRPREVFSRLHLRVTPPTERIFKRALPAAGRHHRMNIPNLRRWEACFLAAGVGPPEASDIMKCFPLIVITGQKNSQGMKTRWWVSECGSMSTELFLLLEFVCVAEAVGLVIHALADSGAFVEHGCKPKVGAASEFSNLGSTGSATVAMTSTRAGQLPFLAPNLSCHAHERKAVYTAWKM